MIPAVKTESEALVGYIDEMLSGIRNAAHGLTDDQARRTPCRSEMSIAGLVNHATWVCDSTLVRLGVREGDDLVGPDSFYASFSPSEGETLDQLLDRFDTARAAYLAAVAELDPDAVMVVPPQPWVDLPEPMESSTRLLLIHHVEEFARHAGHADIIREEIDGAQALNLLFAVEGRPGNEFLTPWRPTG